MIPVAHGLKNDCAGEDQQQFIRPTDSAGVESALKDPRPVRQYNIVMSPVGFRTYNQSAGEGQ
jgi:hypothetical protein